MALLVETSFSSFNGTVNKKKLKTNYSKKKYFK